MTKRSRIFGLVALAFLLAVGAPVAFGGEYADPPIPRAMPPVQIALWDAVLAGDVAGALAAIAAGADVNGLDIRLQTAGPNGRRPLNYAALRNDPAMIHALLRAGALINGTNLSGFTPLHHAGEAGATDAATVLIAHGASLTLKNRRLQTPLETAEAFRHPETAAVIRDAMRHQN